MTTMNIILIAAALVTLILIWRQRPKWLNVVPILLALLAIFQIVEDGFQANMLPVYLVAIGLLIIASRRLLLSKKMAVQPRRHRHQVAGLLGTALALLGLSLAVRATLFFSLPPQDLAGLSWTDAFDSMHTRFSKAYAFGEWKAIDWDVLYDTYAPRIRAAQAAQDRQAYYLALLQYTGTIPDGHVWLEGDDFGTRQQMVGGGYGLEILGLDDDRIIAVNLASGGPAELAGMEWGTEILAWNDLPMETALSQTPVTWPKRRGAPATVEGVRLNQYRLLVRAPIGTSTSVTFRNLTESEVREATLTAVHDGQMDLDGNAAPSLIPVEKGVILPSGYGYLKINNEHEENDPAAVAQQAVQLFVDNGAPGIILDVRGNTGGADDLVPQFAGYFFSERQLYEAITIYFQPLNIFIERPPRLWIEPLEPYYNGPVVVLIDQACFSSGEGIPMALEHLPQATVIGFNGTYGSFGMTGGFIHLPEGLTLHFPDGQSIDAQGVIQLDSNAALEGGVAPTIRVPMTEETARQLYIDHRDVLLDYAINYLEEGK